jgi:hypothetical protein
MDINSITTKEDLVNLKKELIAELLQALQKKKGRSEKLFFTAKEFSALTSIPYQTVIKRCHDGKLKSRQDGPGCCWQISAEELERHKNEANDNFFK